LHKRYYKLYDYGKYLNKYQLQKHLTKLKKLPKYQYYKKVKNSNNYKSAKKQLARLYQKVVNSRGDFFHKLANELAKKYHDRENASINICRVGVSTFGWEGVRVAICQQPSF